MKKYFRTKENNIYKRLFNDGAIIGANIGGSCCDKELNPIGETIIKESDNLEELCDEFRYEDSNKNHIRAYYYGKGVYLDFDTEYTLTRSQISTLKGAIWTDKGLIYVAKINDKGELELL